MSVVPQSDIRRATEIYELFSHLPGHQRTKISYKWPSVQGVYARATGIGYMSDKWDYEERDFIHTHPGDALPYVLRQKRHNDALWKRTFSPKHRAWPKLGHCLDIGVSIDGSDEPYHIDYTDRDREDLPILMADLSRQLLIIVDLLDPDEPALLMHGRKLKITKRGIVG